MTYPRRGLAVVVPAALLLIAACSGDGDDSGPGGAMGGRGGQGGQAGEGGAGGLGGAGGAEAVCNGSADFCSLRFDEIAYPTTHNAMSNAEDDWNLPNQNFNIGRQLEDGVRAMMLDTYDEEGELLLCHVLCGLGSRPLVDGLGDINSFLRDNPTDVFAIIFESRIENSQTAAAIEESGLLDLAYAHVPGEPWPTLQELIDADTRLMVFQEKPGSPEYPWLMYIWDHAWETNFSWEAPEDFNCDPNRGDPDNPLFILNHFLTSPFGGSAELAEMVNYNPLFIDRANQCEDEGNALPNFVTVDFYDLGDLFVVVDSLNAP